MNERARPLNYDSPNLERPTVFW